MLCTDISEQVSFIENGTKVFLPIEGVLRSRLMFFGR